MRVILFVVSPSFKFLADSHFNIIVRRVGVHFPSAPTSSDLSSVYGDAKRYDVVVGEGGGKGLCSWFLGHQVSSRLETVESGG